MKTNNPFIDTMLEAQAQTVNNWMDTTKKFQEAISGGKIQTEGQSIYKEWLEKQMNIYGGSQVQPNVEHHTNESFNKPEEFFKNWYKAQSDQIKKMTEFNQSFYNGYVNYNNSVAENASNWNNLTGSWSNVYTNWMKAINSSYEAMLKNMPNSESKDVFQKFYQGNKVYSQLQEFWSGVYKSWQNQELNGEYFKNMMNNESYRKITEQMFSHFFQSGNMKEFYDSSLKNMSNFFSGNSELYKEYTAAFQNMANEYPQFVSGDFSKFSNMYTHMSNLFQKSFSPVLNMVPAGKEKQSIEHTLKMMDHVALYSVKQAELQNLYFNSSKKSVEKILNKMTEKSNQPLTSETASFNEFYNEWLKISEEEFTTLYRSEDFSRLKSELLSINSDVKSAFEAQFQHQFEVYPVVFRSEMEELHKTIYELKKQVKSLEARLEEVNAKEEKISKKK